MAKNTTTVERAARAWLEPMWRGIGRARTLGLAAEMSFWLFLSLVPLAAVVGLAAARLVTERAAAGRALLMAVPPEARSMLSAQVARVSRWSGQKVAPLAIGMFLWLAASGVHSIFDALEVQTGEERPWWKKRLLALATCGALSLGVAVLGVLAVGLGRLQALTGEAVPHAALEGTIASFVVRGAFGLLMAVGMVTALYRVGIPRAARRRVPALPGAVLAVALVTALGWGYGVYVSATGTGDAYEGSLAVIGITLMTLWLFSLSLLIGAELNRVIACRRTSGGAVTSDPASVESELRKVAGKWPISDESSCRPTSPTPPSERSTGPSPSPLVSAPRSP